VCYLPTPAGAAPAFEQAVRECVGKFEARYSRFRPDSLICRLNAAAGRTWTEIDREMEDMLDVCASVYTLTGGIVDVTTGPLLQLWAGHRAAGTAPALAEIAAARILACWPLVQRQPGRVFLPKVGMCLDFGGWGKEWAADAVARLAIRHGMLRVLVDFGHDFRCIGTPPGQPSWLVELDDPSGPDSHRITVALPPDWGLANSGYGRRGPGAGPMLDPRTGRPVRHGCRQVTVLADTCFQAGLLAATICVLGADAGLDFIRQFPKAEALIIGEAGRVETPGFRSHVVT
jgi:thiamine biosynthesis lipoprotein